MALTRIGRSLLMRTETGLPPMFVRRVSVQAESSTNGGSAGEGGGMLPAGIEKGEVGAISGVPTEHLRRRVVVFQPSKVVTQSGSSKWKNWRITFLSTQKWENPLMGWTSTSDTLANVGEAGLYFDSKEAAIQFAEKHGWEYEVQGPKEEVKTPKSYADNFKWRGPAPQK
ncbi:hypothetical protein CBR_g30252 [Chara braunii]|uniref:NADH dehydrogenase [ubiquinone] iron-sulfur protein 4, mitochondrial n=1 Tax=Chara braunii TaxID=69332 RepID=A0A388LCF8_CHABU|nr:hypothetical protein CBR_g30252 [Chara braunii]|eukprot:GBG79991.1 hypothetical protein CBR_g30252 [Chara braunii]